MKISVLQVGPIQTNCYIVRSGKQTMVVDPGADVDRIQQALEGDNLDVILLTHRHWDHIGAAARLKALTGAQVWAGEHDADAIEDADNMLSECKTPSMLSLIEDVPMACKVDRRLCDGEEVSFGDTSFKVMCTPGHTVGSICMYNAEHQVMLVGDTLFAQGGYGRVDLPGGSPCQMQRTLHTAFTKIPDEVGILPGHGSTSQMKIERNLNSHLI